MKEFFDPSDHPDVQIPMYGLIHLITVLVMIALILLVVLNKKKVRQLVANRRFVLRFFAVYFGIEVIYWSLLWVYRVEPFYERFPLHLCASLSLLMPILAVTQKYNLVRFFSYWAICAGFISYANPGYVFLEPWSFGFIHYQIRHYLILLIPLVYQVGIGFRHTYREFMLSAGVLIVYAGLIFLLDWATGANYMHLGQHNPLEIPFLPRSFTEWPWSYPSFVGVGFVLFHLAFLAFKGLEGKPEVLTGK